MSASRPVLHLRSTGGFLGAENVLLQLMDAGDRNRYRQVAGILHDHRDPPPELATALRDHGHEVHVITCRSRLDFAAIRTIRALCRSSAAAVVHCHGYREDIYAWLSGAGRRAALVATNHNWLRSSAALRLYARLDGLVLRRFDHVIGVSAPIMEELAQAGIRCARRSLVPNGVDLSAFTPPDDPEALSALAAEFGLQPSTPVVGIVASLTPEKGHACLIRAFGKVAESDADSRLLIVGDGPLRPQLEEQVAGLGLSDRVIFAGARRDIPMLLRLMQVFVLSSVREGLPMAILEAMAAGRAIVATDVGDVPRVVENGKSGLIVEPGNAEMLERAIESLLHDADRRGSLGAEALETVRRRFSASAMAEAYFAIYDQVRPSHPRPATGTAGSP